ncbi:hypothetical protein BJY01DRAFT_217073 [Aspergillus pseudoustus]|uniref:Zn(2)-C6 fungal-type domain-containing protein n=1 Tax=Aspergillus pseudoustus TaxID=1810923 RepID=A0ABR4JP92_9EURO
MWPMMTSIQQRQTWVHEDPARHGSSGWNRAARACVYCRDRKIRCCPGPAGCENCLHAGSPCIYPPRASRHRLRRSPGSSVALESGVCSPSNCKDSSRPTETKIQSFRQKYLKEADQTAIFVPAGTTSYPQPHTNIASLWPLTSDQVLNHEVLSILHLLKQHVDNYPVEDVASLRSSLFSPAVQHWLLTQNHKTLSFPTFHKRVMRTVWTRWPLSLPQLSKEAQSSVLSVLPERGVLDQCRQIYSATLFRAIFPVVDPDRFRTLVDSLYASRDTSSPSTTACVFIFTAFIARHASLRSVDSRVYAQKVLTLVPALMLEDPSIEGLETLIMLSLYAITYGKIQLVVYSLSLAVPMIFALGGHRVKVHNMNPDDSHIRRLFWLSYSLDKEVSMRTLRPPLLKDDDCDLDLPAGYLPLPALDFLSTDPVFLFPSDLRLAMMKSRIYHHLYSPRSANVPETEQLKHICSLDEDLDSWKASYLSETTRFDDNLSPEHTAHAIRATIPRLEYYNCIVRIHQASLRCQQLRTDSCKQSTSSEEIVLEACCSTILYTGMIRPLLSSHTFWAFSMSVIPAVIILFGSLINSPHAHRARRIFPLLSDMSATFSSITPARTTWEGLPVMVVGVFLEELMKLVPQPCSSIQ